MAQGQPTQVTTVLTTVEWNALIDKVNNATKNCGGGGIQHVTDPHLWSLQDITTIQGVLKSGCNTAKFTTPVGPPYVWMQTIIDEINKALSAACCNGGSGPSGPSGPTGPTGPTGSSDYYWLFYCHPVGTPAFTSPTCDNSSFVADVVTSDGVHPFSGSYASVKAVADMNNALLPSGACAKYLVLPSGSPTSTSCSCPC